MSVEEAKGSRRVSRQREAGREGGRGRLETRVDLKLVSVEETEGRRTVSRQGEAGREGGRGRRRYEST